MNNNWQRVQRKLEGRCEHCGSDSDAPYRHARKCPEYVSWLKGTEGYAQQLAQQISKEVDQELIKTLNKTLARDIK